MQHLFMKGKGQDRIVNLKNVSFVVIEEEKNRLIFNLDYSIQLENKTMVSDYIYWTFNSLSDLQVEWQRVQDSGYFLIGPEDGMKLINIDKVSSIKFDDRNLRVIWNMCNSIHHKIKSYDRDGQYIEKIIQTSDFVYWDFRSRMRFELFKKSIENKN